MTYLHPDQWPVQPRQWVEHRGKVAAMMPYPGAQPEDRLCLNDDAYTDDASLRQERTREYMRDKCGKCVLQTACAEYGIAHEDYYMYGGLTPDERKQVRKDRGQVLVDPFAAYYFGLGDEPLPELRAEGTVFNTVVREAHWGEYAEG